MLENDEKLEVISTDTSITTPAGTFICYAYKETEQYEFNGKIEIIESISYVAPNIGPIKDVTKGGPNGHTSYSELISYTLK